MFQDKVIGIYCIVDDILKGIGYMKTHNMCTDMLGKSGFCKRVHKIASLLMWMFLKVGRLFKYVHAALEYIIDSFPVKVCHNIRISLSKLLKGEQYRGYNASKREYFYSKRKDKTYQAFIKTAMRKRIETTISEIIQLTPHSIHAVTTKGFLLKILLFVFAYQLKTII